MRPRAFVASVLAVALLLAVLLPVPGHTQTVDARHRVSEQPSQTISGPTPTPSPTPTPAPTPTRTATPTPNPYTLDLEFDAPDPSLVPLWDPTDPGDRLDTDQRPQYTQSQSTYSGGILTMNATRMTTISGRPFAGATWSTYGTFSQLYGTFETRLRYDEADGTWPSLFLLAPGQKGCCPEVDWLEAYGSPACLGPGQVEHVVYRASGGPSSYTIVPMAAGWHTHKMVWTATSLDFYIDGIHTWSVPDPSYVPQVPLYPIFTWGLGANNPNCHADSTTPDNLTMQVDYFRVSP